MINLGQAPTYSDHMLRDSPETVKQCTMNCGPAVGDTRSEEERRADCTDCLTIDVAVPDPEPKTLSHDELVYTVRAMRGFGGSFTQHIGAALQTADSSNSVRLQQAFPDLIEKYGPGSAFYAAAARV